jgi:hypothetical protein
VASQSPAPANEKLPKRFSSVFKRGWGFSEWQFQDNSRLKRLSGQSKALENFPSDSAFFVSSLFLHLCHPCPKRAIIFHS